LRDALAERGIEYVAPGYERALKKRPQAGEVNPEYVTHEYIEEHQVMGDDTIVFVELDDNQAQVCFVQTMQAGSDLLIRSWPIVKG
jgi:hypothetical protein